MKKIIFISLIFSLSITADYSNHKDSQMVIDELVTKHGFEKSYVTAILKNAKKRDEMLQSVANPAEKTKTWDEYRTIFIKTKRVEEGKKIY
jgi:membrane-bound lytic murein transglycosylase B